MPRFIPVYSSQSSEPKRQIIKGGSDALRIDKSEIGKILEKLRENYMVCINEASKEITDQLVILKDYAHRLHGTEAYPSFYKLILKHFNDIGAPRPGTVAAVCCGANYTEGMKEGDKEYAVTCANAIPTPRMKAWPQPANTIIIYKEKNGSPKLKVLQRDKFASQYYVFLIDGITNIGEKEAKLLRHLHTEEVVVYLYKSDGTYQSLPPLRFKLAFLNEDYSEEKRMKENRTKKRESDNENDRGNHFNYVWIFFILLLIIIVIIVVVVAISGKKKRDMLRKNVDSV